MLDERKRIILYALVHDYIMTAAPVGSARLVQKYKLGISAATVRHELAALEEMGYLYQPHTSAGRIPTDEGYRFYVDSLKEVSSGLSNAEQRWVQQSFTSLNKEMTDLMRKTSTLLSQMTNYVAIVLSPALKRSAIKHLDLVSISPRSVLVVVITETGCVVKQVIELKEDASSEDVRRIEELLNEKLASKSAAQIRRGADIRTSPPLTPLVDILLDTVLELLEEEDEADRVFLEGTAMMLKQPEFGKLARVQSLLETLEKGYTMLGLLGDVLQTQTLLVRIGAENPQKEIQECSLVAANYHLGEDTLGAIGLLGPTRMNYLRAISAVECVAQNLNEVLDSMRS
ncbi:MAG: heat-inducible transcription repressor HrcA [Actinobacteria bacterium]|nr:MAG: heat-inducible transcription repressor HrcA [Actinomycetota bacterium]